MGTLHKKVTRPSVTRNRLLFHREPQNPINWFIGITPPKHLDLLICNNARLCIAQLDKIWNLQISFLMGKGELNHFLMKHLEQSGDSKKRPTSWVFFFFPAFGRCYPSVSTCMQFQCACPASHGQIEWSMLTSYYSTLLEQRGMARLFVLVLALGRQVWPDWVERLVVEHNFAMFRLSFGFIVSLRHAWLVGARPRYRMTYPLIMMRLDTLILYDAHYS